MRRALILAALPLLLGCGESITGSFLRERLDGELIPLQVRERIDLREIPASQATILSARIHGMELHLEVEYPACGDHAWSMFVGTDFGASNPPYTLLRLGHDHPTLCLSSGPERRVLRVDLNPLAELGRQAGVGAIRFEILEPGERWPANRQELLFTF